MSAARHSAQCLTDDCEAYKDFLRAPSPDFVGPRFARNSLRWRPFATTESTAEPQKYAVRALRAAFSWLADVRYVAGNPWKAIKDPVVIQRGRGMKIGRAFSSSLWERSRSYIDEQCMPADAQYWRTVRATLLLSGDSGLRREELTVAQRDKMRPTAHGNANDPVWQLMVLEKRGKERTVPVSPDSVAALRAHWADRGLDFDSESEGALIRPIIIPPTPLAQIKHYEGIDRSYSPDGINKMVRWAMKRLIAGMPDLTIDEMKFLAATSPHAFRHTFGTQAAANDVPLDVVQRILGHASLQTTTIYVPAEELRMLREAAAHFAKVSPTTSLALNF